MAEQDLDLKFGDYLGILKRRSSLLLAIIGFVALIGVTIAYRVPPLYTSTGVLLAELPDISDKVVRSTVTPYPEERVRIITQRVLTNENFDKIIADNHLYPELASERGAARSQLHDSIALSAEDPEILASIMGTRPSTTAMAFSLSFTDGSQLVARDVARDLVALYLAENQLARKEQATETMQFLQQESKRLEAEISDREALLAEFKEKNQGALPDRANVNLQLIDRTQHDFDSAEQEIRSLRERQSMYSEELSQLSPLSTILDEDRNPILGPADRLKMLQRQYMQLSTVYSTDHPDVQKLRREIDALSKSTGLPAFDRDTLQSELAAREDELAAARDRYSDDYPDVKRLERTIEGLRAQLASPASRSTRVTQPTPDNPTYIQKQVQLRGVNADLDAAVKRRDQLRVKLNELEGHLTTAPEVEREYSTLTRGYEQLQDQYADLQQKLRQAETALNLETDSSGERFTVLAEPQVPSRPSRPNRLAVLLLTFVIACALGAAGVAVAERSDGTVRAARDVLLHLEIPPLVAIPYVNNGDDLRRRTRTRLLAASALSVWAALVIFLVSTPP